MTVTSLETVTECWKPMVGWEGQYEVSNLGRVRSVDRIVQAEASNGTFFPKAMKGRVLKPRPLRTGHMVVCLPAQKRMAVKGRSTNAYVHRLVLETFVGPAPEGMVARHHNGDVSDNRLENLKWAPRDWLRHAEKAALRIAELEAEVAELKAQLAQREAHHEDR